MNRKERIKKFLNLQTPEDFLSHYVEEFSIEDSKIEGSPDYKILQAFKAYGNKIKEEFIYSKISNNDLKFSVANVDKFFNLNKLQNWEGDIYFEDEYGNTWVFIISHTIVYIAKELPIGSPEVFYYESFKYTTPKSFDELWEIIKDIVPFKKKKKDEF